MELPRLNKTQSATNLRNHLKSGFSLKDGNRRQIEQLPKLDALNELNQCALFNQRSDHRQALFHAEQAVLILQQDVVVLRNKMESAQQDPIIYEQEKDMFLEKTSLLSIAYYNKGCECEHLHKLLNATQAFSRAVNLQSGRHGNQVLLGQFKLSLKQAKFKLRQQMIPKPSKKTTVKQEAESRVRPVSANFHFSALGNEQIPQYQTQYDVQMAVMLEGKVPERPQTAIQEQPINIKTFTSNDTQCYGAVLPHSNHSNTHDRIDELANSSLQNRKNVWSECDAQNDLHNANGIQQAIHLQMQQRPPRNSDLRHRNANQAGHHRWQSSQQKEKVKPTNPQFHSPQNQIPIFTIVDEVVESMEANTSPRNNRKKIKGLQQNKATSSPNQDPLSKTSNFNSKKMLERGGGLSLGSQALFKSFVQPLNLTPKESKLPRKHQSSFAVLPPPTSTQELMKIITHTQALKKPVLQHRVKSSTDVKPKAVQKLQQSVNNVTEQIEEQQPEEDKSFKAKQSLAKRRNVREKFQNAIDEHKSEKLISKEFMEYFESKRGEIVFDNAIKMILGLVKRRKFRSQVEQIMAQLRLNKQAADQEFKDHFESRKDQPAFQKAIQMILGMVKRRRFRRITTMVLSKGRSDLIKRNYMVLYHVMKLQRIFRRKIDEKKASQNKILLKTGKQKATHLIRSLYHKLWSGKLIRDAQSVKEHITELKKISTAQQQQTQLREEKVARIMKASLDVDQEVAPPEINQPLIAVQSNLRRRLFKKISWNDMYLRRIEQHPKRLEYIVQVQSRFRRQKAKRVVNALIFKKRMEDPKYAKAVQMIQAMYRRRKWRNASSQMITKRKAQKANKIVECVVKMQSLFRRIKAIQRVRLIKIDKQVQASFSLMWFFVKFQRRFRRNRLNMITRVNERIGDPVYNKAVKMIQSLFRRRMMRKLMTGALQDQKNKEKKAGNKLKSWLKVRKSKTNVAEEVQITDQIIQKAPEPQAETLEPISEGLEGFNKAFRQKMQNNQTEIVEKFAQAASKIQKWFRRLKIIILVRNAFKSAKPFLVRTVKQKGYFFKCSVQQLNSESLLFTFKSLPSLRSSQELTVKLPEDKIMFSSRQEFALQMLTMVEINQWGKAKFLETPPPAPIKSLLAMPTFGPGKAPQDQDSQSPRRAFRGSIESVILNKSLQESGESAEMLCALQQSFQQRSSTPVVVGEQVEKVKTTTISDHLKVSQDADIGRLLSRPPSGSSSFNYQANQTSEKKNSVISSGSANKVKKDSMTATFSLTAGNQFFPSTLPVLGSKQDQAKPDFSDQESQHFSVPRSVKQQDDVRSMTSSQSVSYKITIEPPGQPIEIKLCFQPAIVKRKNFLMVTLLKRLVPLDRKILPIDIYSGAMAVGLYDLDHFCQDWLMPCLQIKEIKSKKQCIVVNEKLFADLRQRCDLETLSTQSKPLAQQRSNSPQPSISQMGSSQKKLNTIVIPKLKLIQNKNRGVLPLIKRVQTLDSKDYQFEAVFDFDINAMRLTAERPGENLSLDLQLTPDSKEEVSDLYQHAEDIVNQLTIAEKGLELKKANKSVIQDANTVYRDGKQLNGRFYLISVGFEKAQLVIDAYDKGRENRLVLRLDWNSRTRVLSSQEASQLVEKLDVMELAGQLMLIVR